MQNDNGSWKRNDQWLLTNALNDQESSKAIIQAIVAEARRIAAKDKQTMLIECRNAAAMRLGYAIDTTARSIFNSVYDDEWYKK